MSQYETLLVTCDDAGIAVVTVNRPDKLNALNAVCVRELTQAFLALKTDPAVRGIILTGAGNKAFIAGADIAELRALDALGGKRAAELGQAMTRAIEAPPTPVVGAINGYALGGGCEVALACHIRLANEKARLGLPEVGLGIIPGYGGTQRLPRLIGKGRALELVLSGRPVKADEALALGLVTAVFPVDDLLQAARELLTEILSKGPLAVGLALQSVVEGLELDLDRGLAHEANLFGLACGTNDMKEGMSAFLEKRPPNFTAS